MRSVFAKRQKLVKAFNILSEPVGTAPSAAGDDVGTAPSAAGGTGPIGAGAGDTNGGSVDLSIRYVQRSVY